MCSEERRSPHNTGLTQWLLGGGWGEGVLLLRGTSPPVECLKCQSPLRGHCANGLPQAAQGLGYP